MEKVLPFSAINKSFISTLIHKRAALDVSFLVKVFFADLFDHQECLKILTFLQSEGVTFVANATVKSELLDFARRSALTQLVFKEFDRNNIKIPRETQDLIRDIKERKENGANNEKIDPILLDGELKKIRDSFLQRQGISGVSKWSKICKVFLGGKISEIRSILKESGIKYLSYEGLKSENLIDEGKDLEWSNAISICESTGIGFWDSMLINFAETAKVDIVLSLDKDLAYAYAVSSSLQRTILTSTKHIDFLGSVRL